MQMLILSDIHGNLTALNSVLEDAQSRFSVDSIALLGDVIDYGPRSNEVVERLKSIDIPYVCALWGNHEKAIRDGDYSRFSSERGVTCAQNTRENLSCETVAWIDSLPGRKGMQEFEYLKKKILAVHGSLDDPFWQAIEPLSVRPEDYCSWDIVLSGHNHIPHAFQLFYEVNDASMRNKRRVAFINPGSVGQPRNHDPRAHYALWDSQGGVCLCAVEYDIHAEQALYSNRIDVFYKARIKRGI